MTLSIKKRIYFSFFLLVSLFVANGIVSIITLNNNRKLAKHVSTVIDPSLQSLEDFEDMLVASKMYTTNWVFLRSSEHDKDALKRLHNIDYPALKTKLSQLSSKWGNGYMADSLNKVYVGFQQLLVIERAIMQSLKKFEDYDDPVAKLEAERLVEDELLPRTSLLINALSGITSYELNVRNINNNDLEKSFMQLRTLVTALAVIIIFTGIFLSFYMAGKIIKPINRIRQIVNDLGRGITKKINRKIRLDEIGQMFRSVNNLSEKLHATAEFAAEIGNRNFDTYFEPLGTEDALGKALVTMRDNLKDSDENLNEAQHIAKLGSWEWNVVNDNIVLSDEVYNIFNVERSNFKPSYDACLQFIHPGDRAHAAEVIKKGLSDHLSFSYECRIISYKKALKIVCVQGRISTNNKGEVVKLTGVVQDITERKESQKKLEEANRELSILFNSIDEIFFSVSMVTLKVIQISATCEKVYGYKQAEFMANYRLWFDIIHPDDRHVINNEDLILQRGEQINNQYRIIHKDKTIRWVETSITPTLSSTGALVRVDGVTRDITERKSTEEALEKSFSLLEATLESTADGILVVDVNAKVVKVNSKFIELWRVPPEILNTWDDAIGVAFVSGQLIHPEEFITNINELNAREKTTSFDILKFKDGRILERSSQPQLIKGKYVGRVWSFRDITDQKNGEERLIQSEKYNRNLFDQSTVGLALAKTDGKLEDVNEAYAKIIGYTIAECKTKSYYEITPHKYATQELERLKDLELTGRYGPYEKEYTHKNGHLVPVRLSGTFLTKDGIKYIWSSVEDITESKKANEALRLAQFTIENTSHAIYWIKTDGSFYSLNNAAALMLGYSFAELVEMGVSGIDPNYDKGFWAEFWRNLEDKKFIKLFTRHRCKDGRFVDVEIDTHYFRFENLELSCAFVYDVTERKKAEALLKDSEERYRQIVETAQEGIWMIDENNYTILVNKKMADLLEYSTDEMMGKQNYFFMDDEWKHKASDDIERRKKGMSESHDFKYITKSGKIVWTTLSTNPVFDDAGVYKGALAMITDISKRKYNDELLQKSQANLVLNNFKLEQKNKELEQFAYVASHDLQEPLRTTISFVKLFKQQYYGKLDVKADKYLNYIVEASDRMRVLIKDLLDFSRIGHNKELEQVDCNLILKNVTADIDKALKDSGGEIAAGNLPVIRGYATELKQLFQNLLINAIKFRKKIVPLKITVTANQKSDYWQFAFSDNGIGIDAQHNERIFIIFQRLHTRTEYQGSGIGLSHCKKIVELHHGKIWVESIPGQGSTFYFTIHSPKEKINEPKVKLYIK